TCVNNLCVGASANGDSGADAGSTDAGSDTGSVQDASIDTADPWWCLNQPPELTDPNAQISVTFKVFNALKPITTAGTSGGDDFTVLSYTPIAGVSVKTCDALDPFCAGDAATPVTSDSSGLATLTVKGDFNGFFKFEANGYLTSSLYAGQLLPDASGFSPPFGYLDLDQTASLASAIGVDMPTDPDASVGHAFFQAYDCHDRHAAGISFSISVDGGANSIQWYTQGSGTAPNTSATATDSIGAGGIVNVPVGVVVSTATIASTGQVIGTVTTFIRPGAAMFAWFRPRTH
ncbi:MAG TPA: hypothetical protein VGI39_44860, partial [Polyangiaceae bacterium]